MIDYYKILDIPQDSSEIDIKRAFRKKALKFHPDRNKDKYAKIQFQEINEAFEILSDKTRRNEYDDQLNNNCDIDFCYAQELFQYFFATELKPNKIKRKLSVSLNDLYTGTTKKLKIQDDYQQKIVSIPIKPGLKDGTKIVLRELSKDIEFEIQEKPHELYQRTQDNLHVYITLNLFEALFGFHKRIPTLSGQYLTVVHTKPLTSNQQVFIGKGMPNEITGKKGNLIVHYQIDIPSL